MGGVDVRVRDDLLRSRIQRRLPLRPLLAAVLLLWAGTASLPAQQRGAPRGPARVPVTVVLGDSLPRTDAPFVVQRRPDLRPRDVILLRRDATGEDLSEAVRTLLVVRQADGDTATRAATLRMRPGQARRGTPREFPWAGRVLAELRGAGAREVAGIGRVRAVEIWLPPQRRRAR